MTPKLYLITVHVLLIMYINRLTRTLHRTLSLSLEQKNSLKQIENIKTKTSENKKIEARKKCGLKESTNYLLSLPCDLYRLVNYSMLTNKNKSCTCIRSTPVETLHTILLGPCKHLLHTLMSSLSAEDKKKTSCSFASVPLVRN